MGLRSAAGAYEPSKSLEYMVENLAFEALESGRGNTLVEPLCFSLIAFAEASLSFTSFAKSCLLAVSDGCVGVRRALADFTLRGFTALELIFFALSCLGASGCEK